jgi:hypothetical protein
MENEIVEQKQGTEVAVRPVAYYYKDPHLGEEYPVYESLNTYAWWMDGGAKLNAFLSCFKRGTTIFQACYLSAITYAQYRSFRELHEWAPQVIRVYKQLIPLKLKDIILDAAIGNEAEGRKPNAKMALGAIKVFPDIETDPDFNMQKIEIPEGGTLATYTQQALTDENGKVIMKKKTLELYEREHTDGEGKI